MNVIVKIFFFSCSLLSDNILFIKWSMLGLSLMGLLTLSASMLVFIDKLFCLRELVMSTNLQLITIDCNPYLDQNGLVMK